MNQDTRKDYINNIKAEYDKARETHLNKRSDKRYKTIEEARKDKFQIDIEKTIKAPCFTGTKVFENFSLTELVPYIDWTPFFYTWELYGSYPKIFDDKLVGTEAKKLFHDAQILLNRIIDEKLLTAKGVIGFWPANAVGDDIVLAVGSQKSEVGSQDPELTTIHTLRQQAEKMDGEPYYALADFVAQKETGVQDYFGGFAVTTGIGCDELVAEFEKNHDDYNSIMAKALADRLAEAFAERMHELVRKEYWGYAKDEKLKNEDLIEEKYTGIRPAPGYPACPDHTEKETLFHLLDAENKIGLKLTESFAMYPTAAVSGFYFAHPRSRYFGLGKITKDQVEDYATRKKISIKEAEKWLSPNLAY